MWVALVCTMRQSGNAVPFLKVLGHLAIDLFHDASVVAPYTQSPRCDKIDVLLVCWVKPNSRDAYEKAIISYHGQRDGLDLRSALINDTERLLV